MNAKMSLGIDFGSMGYYAAIAIAGRIVSLPVGPLGQDLSLWITYEHGSTTQNEVLRFPSIKECITKSQTVIALEKRAIPAELVAAILEEIRLMAEGYTKRMYSGGAKIGQTVIAVPATYSESRREALLKATKKAGLQGARLINDAILLAMEGALHQPQGAIFLIYNAGYAQCEIAVVRQTQTQFQALAYESMDKPCGRIFDEAILGWFINELQEKGYGKSVLRFQPQEWLSLRHRVSTIKEKRSHLLTVHSPPQKRIPFIIPWLDFDQQVEQVIHENIALITKTLQTVNLSLNDVSQVLVTGGTSKMDVIQRALSTQLGHCPIRIMPDDTIARGAATFAANLMGIQTEESIIVKQQRQAAVKHLTIDFSPLKIPRPNSLPNISDPIRLQNSQPTSLQHPRSTVHMSLAQRLIQKAYKLLQRGEYEKAVHEARDAFTAEPDSYQILDAMIEIHLQAAQSPPAQIIQGYQNSIEWLKWAYSSDQSRIEIVNLIADRHFLHTRQLYERRDISGALEAIKKCLKVNQAYLEALEFKKQLMLELKTKQEPAQNEST